MVCLSRSSAMPINSRLVDLVDRYDRLVDLARQRRLAAGETGGSIATVTNYGVFGLTIATPIPLPEQTLLLGMGCGQVVPHWEPAKQCVRPSNRSSLHVELRSSRPRWRSCRTSA